MMESVEVKICSLNIQGQSQLDIAKQFQIEHFIQTHKLDIIHLQESYIKEDSFSKCPYIANNFQLLHINNPSKYGVCSLIRKDIEISKEILHPSGRVLIFDALGCTFANVYLPSGSDAITRNSREEFCSQTLPNLLFESQNKGIAAGDWNCIIRDEDCTANPGPKTSPSLKRLVQLKDWKDTFLKCNPNQTTFSHYYNRLSEGILKQGATRLDRSYAWGNVDLKDSGYSNVAFSDHFAHLLTIQIQGQGFHSSPKSRPPFKIYPNIASDEIFKLRIHNKLSLWLPGKNKVPIQRFWDSIKVEIRKLAMERNKELRKEQQMELNFLTLAQTHLSDQVLRGDMSKFSQLDEINKRIIIFFKKRAEQIKIQCGLQDIDQSEQLRVYHYEIHKRELNKRKILKLKTPEGLKQGHRECADFLNKEVKNLLENEIFLDEECQNQLLGEVESVFTQSDNKLLEKTITKNEILECLKKCNPNSSPGLDSITYRVYLECWESLGDLLVELYNEIYQSGVTPKSMKGSLMIFTPKPGKGKSCLSNDLRRISLLNCDLKLMTKIFTTRLQHMADHVLSPYQFSSGSRNITEAIVLARDAISFVKPSHRGAAICDLDFQKAFDFLSVSWSWKVYRKKNASEKFTNFLENLYSNNFTHTLINDVIQPKIENKRLALAQGDGLSCFTFNFAIDALVTYIEKRLEGIKIFSIPTQGPSHPKWGKPPEIELRYKVCGFLDDLKPGIVKREEFFMVDNAIRLFEGASGCKLHRDPASQKCKALFLGKWSKWKKSDIPINYIVPTEHLDYLGVKLGKNNNTTRAINGDYLVSKVKSTVQSFKSGKFSPLTSRPWSINSFVWSKILYRSSVIDIRKNDIKKMISDIKSFVYQDLLIKPAEQILFRNHKKGGLGVIHPGAKSEAALIKTFISLAHPKSSKVNIYLNYLFRYHIMEEEGLPSPKRAASYNAGFFRFIKEIYDTSELCIFTLSTKQWYNIILEQGITFRREGIENNPRMILTSTEIKYKEAVDWGICYELRRLRGLSPSQKSCIFKYCENLWPTGERLFKLKKQPSPLCELCHVDDDIGHFWQCNFNSNMCKSMKDLLKETTQHIVGVAQLATCGFPIADTFQLPVMYIFSEFLEAIIQSKTTKVEIRNSVFKTSTINKAKLFMQSQRNQSAYEKTRTLMLEFF